MKNKGIGADWDEVEQEIFTPEERKQSDLTSQDNLILCFKLIVFPFEVRIPPLPCFGFFLISHMILVSLSSFDIYQVAYLVSLKEKIVSLFLKTKNL